MFLVLSGLSVHGKGSMRLEVRVRRGEVISMIKVMRLVKSNLIDIWVPD